MLANEEHHEIERLRVLADLRILNTPYSPAFDAIVEAAAAIFDCPIGLVSLVAEENQWFKARCGIDLEGTDRKVAFCDHTIRSGSALIVADARHDPRFADNPFVLGEPHIRFYAGIPLSVDDTYYIGSLCVIGTEPKEVGVAEIGQLRRLARAVEGLLLAHRAAVHTNDALEEAREQRRKAERREKLLAHVESMAAIGAWRVDLKTGEVAWSDQVRRIHDVAEDTVITLDFGFNFYAEHDRDMVRSVVGGAIERGEPFHFDADFVTANGRPRRVRVAGDVEHVAGAPLSMTGIFQDITDEYHAEQQLWRSANIDALCGIPNRNWFQQALREKLDVAEAAGGELTLMLLDLDGFKEINDTLGHLAGDAVLAVVARRLKAVVGEQAAIARLGGDEFTVLIDRPLPGGELRRLADDILAELRKPACFDNQSIYFSASMGIAHYPADAATADDFMRAADMALYKIKRAGRGSVGHFSPEIATIFDTRRLAIEKVRRAGAEGRIVPFYQPKVRLADRSVYGFEALARIRNTDGTISGPADFWSAFADATSARLISQHIMAGITEDIARWLDAGLDPGVVSFNAGEFSFQTPDFAAQLIRRLEQKRIPRAMIEIEVTETVFWGEDSKLVGKLLEQLHGEGIRISLDDFGTGYASLTHLRDFPIDCIKIDQTFIAGLGARAQHTTIVNAIVDLGHNLGMDVVAEGIETEPQLDFLRSVRCNGGQGFLFSRAVPASEAAGMLGRTAAARRA
jgi:diguanylate cyclase (GGDEF)-like protein/PAS domain S-box-containing protein